MVCRRELGLLSDALCPEFFRTARKYWRIVLVGSGGWAGSSVLYG
jgi:hypothetical protein